MNKGYLSSWDYALPQSDAQYGGLTKREWFAGQVVIGLCLNNREFDFRTLTVQENLARMAFGIADAMLAEGARK